MDAPYAGCFAVSFLGTKFIKIFSLLFFWDNAGKGGRGATLLLYCLHEIAATDAVLAAGNSVRNGSSLL